MTRPARYFRLYSASPTSLQSPLVTVEIVIRPGIPRHTVVGLAQGAIKESLDRIRAALAATGLDFPRGAITVNLAPADMRKDGSAFDLPMALGILAADGQIDTRTFQNEGWLVMGELMLDARVRPVEGVMPAILSARQKEIGRVVLPSGNVPEAGAFPGLAVGAVSTIREAIDVMEGRIEPMRVQAWATPKTRFDGPDFGTVVGQEASARVLAIAAAGSHNVLMSGPPGCGKTLMARCMEGIQPSWSRSLALEATSLHSLRRPGLSLLERRPFRRPHHTISSAGLLGGGTPLRPGEISLAHGGILFLDELPEFSPRVLEGLREPLEEGKVTLSRAHGVEEYPSDFQLVAAMNPCPCGHAGNDDDSCRCTERRRSTYMSRISGPLMDRIEIQMRVPQVNPMFHLGEEPTTSSMWLQRVEKAKSRLTKNFPPMSEKLEASLVRAVAQLRISMRAAACIRRIASTIAAFEDADTVTQAHLSEAIRIGGQGRRDVTPRVKSVRKRGQRSREEAS